MGAEKVAAFYESWSGVWIEMLGLNLEASRTLVSLWWSTWTGTRRSARLASPYASRAAIAVLSRGVRPIHRRAVANARRLRRATAR
jgi:hypothetical protein